MFRSHAPRAAVAALTAAVLIVGLMASTTSAAPKPSANRIIYFGDAPKVAESNGVLTPSLVSAGNVFEFTLFIQNDGKNRLTHSELGYGSRAVAQSGAGASLPAGASIVSATFLTGAGSCNVVDEGLGALCDLGDFDSGETATVQMIVNAPSSPGSAFTYASFKVAENVADQGANRNTVYANSSGFVIAPTNSNSNATYKTGGAFTLSTNGNTLVAKDSMTTTVTGPDGVGAISISETNCDKSCVGQIATVHVREGASQAPGYLEWTLKITGSISGVITHTLDNGQDVSFSGSCTNDLDGVDCIVSNTKNGNQSTIVFRTLTNGKIRAN